MIINVHAGHNPHGCIACGCNGYLSESRENRIVKDYLISLLQKAGHTVYDCTVNDGISQNDVLQKIVAKCNVNNVDLDISLHFNAATTETARGTECWCYNASSKAVSYASRICESISELGFKNRGVKYNSGFYVLRKTKAPSIIIEICFATSAKDAQLYNPIEIANAIYHGITGDISLLGATGAIDATEQDSNNSTNEPVDSETQNTFTTDKIYRVCVTEQKGAFHSYENALKLQKELELQGYKTIITE